MNTTFFPRLPSALIDPFYIIRKKIYLAVKENAHFITGNVLDFGCGSKPYQSLFNFKKYVGADIENPGHDHRNESIDIFFDGINLPLGDETFNSCFSSEVFEHVFEADRVLKEINRVLVNKGILVITTPFAWDEHEVPHDFCRYTSFGLKALLERNGYNVISLQKYGTFQETLFQMLLLYGFKSTLKWKITRVSYRLIVVPLLNILALIFTSIFPSGGDSFYLGQIVVAEKVS